MRGSAGPPTAASRTLSQNRQTGRRSGETLRSGQPLVAAIERVSRTNSPRGAAMLLSPAAEATSAPSRAIRNRRRMVRLSGGSECAMLCPMPELPHAPELTTADRNGIHFPQLRAARLARLQTMMKRYDLPVALLYTTANIRYATGADVMGVWTAGTFARYCLVPAEGAPILFEYKGSVHVSQKVVGDVRPAYPWQYGGVAARDKAREWARSIRATLRELGLERERLAVDKLDAVGFVALQEEGIAIVDVGPATVDAREVKTPQEVGLFALNGAIGDAMLAEFEAAIRPGIREYELLAVLSDALLRRQGEGLFTRLVASGTNTNPWLTEAQDKAVMPGELVGVDTDANGVEGYVIDVSRTFLCGDVATPEQKEAYRVAYDCGRAMLA